MKKSKFIRSTLILLIGGFVTKILGMVIKIVTSRLIPTEGVGLYMMIMPTFTLLISLAQMGLPIAISKLVSEDTRNNKKIVFSCIPMTILLNIIIFIVLFFASDFIAIYLLHEERCKYAIKAIGFVLPFISISSIFRGYFFGKEKMIPHVVSNVTEDIVRLIVLTLGIPLFLQRGLEFTIAFLVLSNIISELTSILILFFFVPKSFSLKPQDFVPNKNDLKDILGISIPTTASRLIGSIGYFFEPINGYSNNFIVSEYGILNGYVMPLILLPSFFTSAISQALIPVVSNQYTKGNKVFVKKKIKQAIFISLLIGIPATILFTLVPDIFLRYIYNTNEGITYIKVLAPICLLHYVQSPISSSLQAMGHAKDSMKGTLLGMILRTLFLIVGCNLKIGLWGLVLATSANIIFVTLFDGSKIKQALK